MSAALRAPALEPLHGLIARLDAAGLRCALGGSGLLAALGLADHVNDWDVTVDCTVETLRAACAGLEYLEFGNSGCHADHKFTFGNERTELIAHFAFVVPGGVVRIPTLVTRRWNNIPIGSPSGWAAAYALLADAERDARRAARADALFAWMERQGADAAGLEALGRQPLPPALRARLDPLPRG